MGLKDYTDKRDFAVTPEPAGHIAPEPGHRYVIQKHAARNLHYDLRLELDGVLLSWAVPKGPSLDPLDKRFARQTEDHPIAYGDFEGVIPQGQYGGGTVMVWDHGTWEPLGDSYEQYRKGALKFIIHGIKLRGAWTLIRLKGPKTRDDRDWLFIKERDDAVRPRKEYDVLDSLPDSAATGRTMEQIAVDKDRVWSVTRVPGEPRISELDPSAWPGARVAPLPEAMAPQRATPRKTVPAGDDWIHEIAFDGARILGIINGETVRLLTSDGEDWTNQLPEITRSAEHLGADDTVLDGVVVLLNASGASDGGALRRAVSLGRTSELIYYIFDLPFFRGVDLTGCALLDRKALLARALQEGADHTGTLRLCEHIVGNGPTVLEQATGLGLAGVISKRADSHYVFKRTSHWTVVHCPGHEIDAARTPAASPHIVIEPGFDIEGVRMTNPQRILYPETGVTKQEIAEFYREIADWVLPHVTGRPLSLVRCPQGHDKNRFYQKHLHDVGVSALREVVVKKRNRALAHIVIDDLSGLLTLAQLAVLEIHPWGSREDKPNTPDRIVFDMDPGPDVAWPEVVEGAHAIHGMLEVLGLASFVKTSGGKGLHIVVPIIRRSTWDDIKHFSQLVAEHVARIAPQQYTASIAMAQRDGRIFIDYLRNTAGATCVAAYSTRAVAGAPVSTPLSWDELTPDIAPNTYTVRNLPKRLRALTEDPWAGFFEVKQGITKATVKRLTPDP